MRISEDVCNRCWEIHCGHRPHGRLISQSVQSKRTIETIDESERFALRCCANGRNEFSTDYITGNRIPEDCNYQVEHTVTCELKKDVCQECRNNMGLWWWKWSEIDEKKWNNNKLRCPAFIDDKDKCYLPSEYEINISEKYIFMECMKFL